MTAQFSHRVAAVFHAKWKHLNYNVVSLPPWYCLTTVGPGRKDGGRERVGGGAGGGGLDRGAVQETRGDAISCPRQPTPFSDSWSMCTPMWTDGTLQRFRPRFRARECLRVKIWWSKKKKTKKRLRQKYVSFVSSTIVLGVFMSCVNGKRTSCCSLRFAVFFRRLSARLYFRMKEAQDSPLRPVFVETTRLHARVKIFIFNR